MQQRVLTHGYTAYNTAVRSNFSVHLNAKMIKRSRLAPFLIFSPLPSPHFPFFYSLYTANNCLNNSQNNHLPGTAVR